MLIEEREGQKVTAAIKSLLDHGVSCRKMSSFAACTLLLFLSAASTNARFGKLRSICLAQSTFTSKNERGMYL
ncbi:hypothetical protein V5799_023750 [Amblyomma americanum]|uniref:Uncharacterized protein n=1 Tax=Amblyomma americanum TaxID=6943 RepID=A0AAQ4FIB6_AMBAM